MPAQAVVDRLPTPPLLSAAQPPVFSDPAPTGPRDPGHRLQSDGAAYSHSIVPGGLDVMS